MILKEKQLINAVEPRAIAGQKQEKDVAFYLRRAFKDDDKVFVINDFRFSHNNEKGQIDHLIAYPYGFILVESKSISGEVQINKHGEWARTVGRNWTGMPSPIKQVELQQKLLKEFLHEHRAEILPKLLGIKTQTFGKRCWHNLCAVSSNSIIDRDNIPPDLSSQIVKSEFVIDTVKKIMNFRSKVVSIFSTDTRPDFNACELHSITSFLLRSRKYDPALSVKPDSKKNIWHISKKTLIRCKNCKETKELIPRHGRYGYFVNCNSCDTNTSLKMPCPNCTSNNTKISKSKETYSVNCQDCSSTIQII